MTSYGMDLLVILPELIIVAAACLVLVLDPVLPASRKELLAWLSLGSLALCIGLTGGQINVLNLRITAFSDLVVVDGYARFWKLLLCGVTGLTILMSLPYLKAERLHLGEYYGFTLLALSGMMVMVSGADLLTIYLGTELMSLSLYVMAGLKRSSPRSLEASAKYFVLGAFSSGLLLYGISLLYGIGGSTRLTAIAAGLGTRGFDDPMVLIATILVAVGFAFKLAVVPFHMWTPDVYQGAPTSVTAFMAVASKAASFAAFLRVFIEGLGGLRADWSNLFLLLCIVTLILGNVVAIVQTNLKRMLAYSSIAHAGYALVGFITSEAAPVGFYLLVYSLMSVGAFAVIQLLARAGDQKVETSDYAGIGFQTPALSFALAIFLFSLAGIPPTAGFMSKFFIFKSAWDGAPNLRWLVVVAVINSIISVYYYLYPIVVMFFRPLAPGFVKPKVSAMTAAALILALVGTLYLGILPNRVMSAIGRSGGANTALVQPAEK